jgi:hypothetical protein
VEIGDRLQGLDLAVGRIVSAVEQVGARAPSALVTVDLGPQGRQECTVPRGTYDLDELEGKQVVCARRGDELLVLAAHSHAAGLVLLRPDRDVEDGSIVG